MNTKGNLIQIGTLETRQIHWIPETAPIIFIAPDVRSEVAISARNSRRPGYESAQDGPGEFWETVTSLLLWLCGLIAIAFCLL